MTDAETVSLYRAVVGTEAWAALAVDLQATALGIHEPLVRLGWLECLTHIHHTALRKPTPEDANG